MTSALALMIGWLSPALMRGAEPADSSPVPISQKVPEYPLTALAKARDGEVVVEFIVTTTGKVQGVHAVRSTDPVFEAPAEMAVAQWVFRPGMKAGRPVKTRMQVPIVFHPSDQQLAALQGKVPTLDPRLPFSPPKKQVPLLPANMVPVYPYRALLENQHVLVTGEVEFDARGEPGEPTWGNAPPPEFAGAVEAMLDAVSGTKIDGRLLTGKRRLRWQFDAHDGQVRVSDEGAVILKRLRVEGENTAFATPDELDAKLQPVVRPDPVFPRSLTGKLAQGEAKVEFYIDPTGRVQLPHVLTASDAAFGYAACQAVAGWQYQPPLRNGRATIVKTTATLQFGSR